VWFKPRLCYIRDAIIIHGDNDDCTAYDNATRIVKRKYYHVCAEELWAMMADAEKAQWEAFSRRQLALQPHIHDKLNESMRERLKSLRGSYLKALTIGVLQQQSTDVQLLPRLMLLCSVAVASSDC
jgi:hypothetical protein